MKRIIVYALILASVAAVPIPGTDVGKLQPVELISVTEKGHELVIETDTGDIGKGATIDEALADLKKGTAGEVFLDTADYLLVTEQTIGQLQHIRNYLKENVKVCIRKGELKLAEAAHYLEVHTPEQTLADLEEEKPTQVLIANNGRMKLE